MAAGDGAAGGEDGEGEEGGAGGEEEELVAGAGGEEGLDAGFGGGRVWRWLLLLLLLLFWSAGRRPGAKVGHLGD